MKVLVALALFALAYAQNTQHGNPHRFDHLKDYFNENQNDTVIDFISNFRFEDLNDQNGVHLIVAISDATGEKKCYLIEVAAYWEAALTDDKNVDLATEEIYKLIENSNVSVSELSHGDLKQMYGDNELTAECFKHDVYVLKYSPSFATPPPTTAPPPTDAQTASATDAKTAPPTDAQTAPPTDAQTAPPDTSAAP